MYDVVVIGGGLFGSITAAALRREGHEVLVVDAAKEGAGSKPAACLMKPSWFSSMGKDKSEPSLRLLDELYGVKDLSFRLGPLLSGTIHWCDPASILVGADLPASVTAVLPVEGGWQILTEDSGFLLARRVVVAAGVWSGKLVEVPGLVGRAGVAFRWKNHQLQENFVRPWAPYRQTVGFNISPSEVWVGDGSAIKPENWNTNRQEQSYGRCAQAIGRVGLGDLQEGRATPLYGVRPYVPGVKPCLLLEAAPGLWVNTGGAKNGTIAAGWSASELVRAFA